MIAGVRGGDGAGFDGETWQVRSRDSGEGAAGALVGEILIDDADFPWLSGRFRPGPAHAAVQDLFARELALVERDDAGHRAEWEEVCAEIERRVRLLSPDGPVAEFLLHIEGDRAWFRWSDEPFERAGDDG
ncbi:hypothetical protein ACGF3J_22690 [Streptomyces sp. NPDC048171]|uniref:hypothetical protein n=1 Tax=Streptomyces sp. NPDC048171 TaxID=3365504 RepID=UPI0037117840